MPFDKNMSSVIHQIPDFHSLDSNDVLSEFISMGVLIKAAKNSLARARGVKKANLVLEAKMVHVDEGGIG